MSDEGIPSFGIRRAQRDHERANQLRDLAKELNHYFDWGARDGWVRLSTEHVDRWRAILDDMAEQIDPARLPK